MLSYVPRAAAVCIRCGSRSDNYCQHSVARYIAKGVSPHVAQTLHTTVFNIIIGWDGGPLEYLPYK